MVLNEHKTRVRELAAEFNLSHPSREPLDLAAAIGAKLEYGDLGDKDGAFDPNRNVDFFIQNRDRSNANASRWHTK